MEQLNQSLNQPRQPDEPEPLCDPGRPSGLVNLTTWALGILVIWAILLLGIWKLLSPLYQETAGPQPPAEATAGLSEISSNR